MRNYLKIINAFILSVSFLFTQNGFAAGHDFVDDPPTLGIDCLVQFVGGTDGGGGQKVISGGRRASGSDSIVQEGTGGRYNNRAPVEKAIDLLLNVKFADPTQMKSQGAEVCGDTPVESMIAEVTVERAAEAARKLKEEGEELAELDQFCISTRKHETLTLRDTLKLPSDDAGPTICVDGLSGFTTVEEVLTSILSGSSDAAREALKIQDESRNGIQLADPSNGFDTAKLLGDYESTNEGVL